MRALARGSLVVLVAAALSVAPSTPGFQPPASGQVEQPNVLVVITDDQPVGTLDVMPKTRRWFKSGGVDFTNAFATTPLCCPSRGSIFSGRYAHNHGITTNSNPGSLDQDATVQRYLQDAGFLTGIAGKFLNGWDREIDPPHFDRWSIFEPSGYFDTIFNVDGELRDVPGYSTDFVAREAVGLLEDFEGEDASPWLLFVTPFAGHGPYTPATRHETVGIQVPELGSAAFEGDRSDKALFLQQRNATIRSAEAQRRLQLRTLLAADEMVDDVMTALQDLGELQDTLAFFMSDNGFMWRDHGFVGKRLPYLPSIRIPFLVRWPGHLSGGSSDDRVIANIDIAPTILEAAGVSPSLKYPFDGWSLLATHSRSRLLLEYFRDPGAPNFPTWASIFEIGLQYIEYYRDDVRTFAEYYDLEWDPSQLVNLLGDADTANDPLPTELSSLESDLQDLRGCAGTTGQSACP
ncbi:MAG: sulfatase family protein [Actinomycetota bacterium]